MWLPQTKSSDLCMWSFPNHSFSVVPQPGHLHQPATNRMHLEAVHNSSLNFNAKKCKKKYGDDHFYHFYGFHVFFPTDFFGNRALARHPVHLPQWPAASCAYQGLRDWVKLILSSMYLPCPAWPHLWPLTRGPHASNQLESKSGALKQM